MTGDRSPLAARARAQLAGQTPAQFAEYQRNYMKLASIDEAVANSIAERSSLSDAGAAAEFAAQLLLLDLRPQLPAIKVPVVEVSPFYAPDLAPMNVDEAGKTGYYRMLLAGVGNLDVVSISPARHFVMFDQPEKFAAALDHALGSMVESPSK
jgi:pimeloyl-ACP methyl ester carboxylesterase